MLPKPWRVARVLALGVRGEDFLQAPAGQHPRTTGRPPKPAAEPAEPPVPKRPRGGRGREAEQAVHAALLFRLAIPRAADELKPGIFLIPKVVKTVRERPSNPLPPSTPRTPCLAGPSGYLSNPAPRVSHFRSRITPAARRPEAAAAALLSDGHPLMWALE